MPFCHSPRGLPPPPPTKFWGCCGGFGPGSVLLGRLCSWVCPCSSEADDLYEPMPHRPKPTLLLLGRFCSWVCPCSSGADTPARRSGRSPPGYIMPILVYFSIILIILASLSGLSLSFFFVMSPQTSLVTNPRTVATSGDSLKMSMRIPSVVLCVRTAGA